MPNLNRTRWGLPACRQLRNGRHFNTQDSSAKEGQQCDATLTPSSAHCFSSASAKSLARTPSLLEPWPSASTRLFLRQHDFLVDGTSDTLYLIFRYALHDQ
jgi:hypothetical protein